MNNESLRKDVCLGRLRKSQQQCFTSSSLHVFSQPTKCGVITHVRRANNKSATDFFPPFIVPELMVCGTCRCCSDNLSPWSFRDHRIRLLANCSHGVYSECGKLNAATLPHAGTSRTPRDEDDQQHTMPQCQVEISGRHVTPNDLLISAQSSGDSRGFPVFNVVRSREGF